MNFSCLPDNVFVKILEYLPLEECIRSGGVDKTFRRISQLTTSHTKSLDLTEGRFENLRDDQLAIMLDLCSSNLKWIKFPSRDTMEKITKTTDWKARHRRENILDKHGRQLATVFAFYHCPRLIDIDIGRAPIDPATFNRLIRNNPNVESLIWRGKLVGFPNVTTENLKKLTLNCTNDTSVQSIIGRCPNLEELELTVLKTVSAKVLDQVFASIPHANRVDLLRDWDELGELGSGHKMRPEKELINLWNLPLTSLDISFLGHLYEDDILYKVASSFPHLQTFRIGFIGATRDGIASLATLQDLEVLEFLMDYECVGPDDDDYQDGLCQLTRCKKLRKLGIDASLARTDVLTTLIRGCPQLNYISISEVGDVSDRDEVVEFLEDLLGIENRDITIRFQPEVTFKSIWRADSVKEMIETLKDNYGLKIKFTWIPEGWQQTEDDSSDSSDTDMEESTDDD